MLVSVKEGRLIMIKKDCGGTPVWLHIYVHILDAIGHWKKMKISKNLKGIVEQLWHAANNFSIQKQMQKLASQA